MRVALLDDDSKNFAFFRSILGQVWERYPPTRPQPEQECSEFNDALQLVSRYDFDLVLVDLSWDTFGHDSQTPLGLTLIRACRDRSPRAVIVALTKVGSSEDLTKAREYGADIALRLQDALQNVFEVSEQVADRLHQVNLDDPASPPGSTRRDDSIFIVHGHKSELRNEVELVLRQAGLRPVVLLARSNRGRTLAEKFEDEASSCSFAVVLATGDDAVADGSGGSEFRARQNVIFELGWFQGRLGRQNTLLLCDPGVTLPSDVVGTVYVATAAWKLDLLKELLSVGFEVDLSSVH